MYIGFDPTPTWTSERPSRNYDPGLNRNQSVMRAGTVQATYPLRSRSPAVLDEMMHVINRQGVITQGRAPARNDSEAVRIAYDRMLAQQQGDGSIALTPFGAKEAIRQVKTYGKASIPVRNRDGSLGRLTITPDDIRSAPPDALLAARQISVAQAQASEAGRSRIPTGRTGWRR